MNLTVRSMKPEELSFAVELAAREGWNPGLHDARTFVEADPRGFLLAEVDGQPVGCISAISYQGRFGFIGLYLVVPEWRGKGVGMKLWNAGMARLKNHLVGLDGVPAQQDNYRRSGFRLAYQNVRYEGVARSTAIAPSLVPLRGIDFEALQADDRRVFPSRRARFLRAWIDQPDSTSFALIEKGKVAGWGLVRACRNGHKIGPLVADRPNVARDLFDALLSSVPAGDLVFLDVPVPNDGALALAGRNGMRDVFRTARMYTGDAPNVELGRVYGVTTFELG